MGRRASGVQDSKVREIVFKDMSTYEQLGQN